MAHRDSQDCRRVLRLPVQGRRTHILVALIGFLLSVGLPVAVLSASGPTVEGQRATRLPDNPAGLGVTGALPADPPPAPTSAVPDSGAATPPGRPALQPAPGRVPDSGAASPPGRPALQPAPGPVPDSIAATRPAIAASHPVQTSASDSAGARQPRIAVASHLPEGPLGIPGVMLSAYQRAAQALAASQPGCHLSWSVLAGIGRIESGHASNGRVDAAGNTLGPILGPRLDGSPGMAAIPDTDHGVLDGDLVWDRAVGPMQFIPSSWRRWGLGSPNNIYDSTLAAGGYLCSGGANLSDPTQLHAAVYRYNHSATYVDVVLQWAAAYLTGVIPEPSAPGPVPPGINGNGGRPTVADPGPQAAAAPATIAPPPPPPATPLTTTNPPPPAPTPTSIKPTSSISPPPAPASSPFSTPARSATPAPGPISASPPSPQNSSAG